MKTMLKKTAYGIAILAAATLSFELLRHETEDWTKSITVNGEPVRVTITNRRHRGIMKMGHWYLIEGDIGTFSVEMQFPDSHRIVCQVPGQPLAIWYLDKQLYVACCSGDFIVARIDGTGGVMQITPQEFPDGPRPWNLEDPQYEKELEEAFARWLKCGY